MPDVETNSSGTQRDIGRIEGRMQGLERDIGEVKETTRAIWKTVQDLSTKEAVRAGKLSILAAVAGAIGGLVLAGAKAAIAAIGRL